MGKMHHLSVGCADCTVIKTATGITFLVDCHNIENYSHLLPASKVLRGVFITHQHRDHYSGLDYLRNRGYTIQYLIYSPYVRRRDDASVTLEEWNEFDSHRSYFEKKGTQPYTPYRQESFDSAWWTPDGLKFWMFGPEKGIATSATREIHDASLIFRADLNTRYCLFTGDASDTSLNFTAKNTTNICNDILHASHHGSLNGADVDFVKKCNASFTVISTATGVHENVPHPTAMKRYKDHTKQKVYRTDEGSVEWTF